MLNNFFSFLVKKTFGFPLSTGKDFNQNNLRKISLTDNFLMLSGPVADARVCMLSLNAIDLECSKFSIRAVGA
jgi:hypothetical protein